MINIRHLYVLVALATAATLAGFRPGDVSSPEAVPQLLSEYGFFTGETSAQVPAEGVVPYQLNTPLFSDYAEKLRFVKLPEGLTTPYQDSSVFDFPIGTTLIKTFYYYHDARQPSLGRRLMETRLLIHKPTGWQALTYHWNEAQTDAVLEVAGGRKPVSWINAAGKTQQVEYYLPNVNECKGCHNYSGKFRPIGPSARQLNGQLDYPEGAENQLVYWKSHDMLTGMESVDDAPRAAVWNDASSGTLDQRARAWLDINCAHCHNPKGPASTTGLFLDFWQKDPKVLGIHKPPVAAGRGSGGRKVGIKPGKPDDSILYYRISSADPGVMMPELARKLVHEEGVALIREWIAAMDTQK